MSGGGGFHKSFSKSKTEDLTPQEYASLRPEFADLFSSFVVPSFRDLSQGFEGGDIDLGNFRAPVTAGELSALEGLRGLNDGSANENLSSDLLGRTLAGDFFAPENNPYLADVLRYTNEAINSTYNDQGLQQRALFARAGQRLSDSSPFSQAAAELESGRLDAIGRNTSEILQTTYEAERGRQVQAVEAVRAQAGFEFQRQLETLRSEALPRLVDELGFERAFTEFQNRLQVISAALGVGASLTQPALGQFSSGRAYGTQNSGSLT